MIMIRRLIIYLVDVDEKDISTYLTTWVQARKMGGGGGGRGGGGREIRDKD